MTFLLGNWTDGHKCDDMERALYSPEVQVSEDGESRLILWTGRNESVWFMIAFCPYCGTNLRKKAEIAVPEPASTG